MPISISNSKAIKARAFELGFAQARFIRVSEKLSFREKLGAFLAQNFHGSMGWMETRMEERAAPKKLWSEAQSILMLAMQYDGPENHSFDLAQKSQGVIAAYARGHDYHDVIKGKLKILGGEIAAAHHCEVKVFVDTAPVMEKPLGQKAGLGWQGKHSNLVSREIGNWFFLGAIFIAADFAPDKQEIDHCGSCRACLDACPTKAFPAPYQLDARRCISYLTIEHKGHIAPEFRQAMGNHIFGCDDCLAACPWNKFAQKASEAKFVHREALSLSQYLAMNEAEFRAHFAGSPVKRTGYARFMRNCLIAAGNSDDQALLPLIRSRLSDVSPLVPAMAIWALARLAPSEFQAQRRAGLADEKDADVLAEWQAL